MSVNIWLDDTRPAPEGFIWCKSVNQAKHQITILEFSLNSVGVIDCDHDLGDYAKDGGDGIKLLDWLEKKHRHYIIRLHTMNPVGRQNMEAVIKKNRWTYVPW